MHALSPQISIIRHKNGWTCKICVPEDDGTVIVCEDQNPEVMLSFVQKWMNESKSIDPTKLQVQQPTLPGGLLAAFMGGMPSVVQAPSKPEDSEEQYVANMKKTLGLSDDDARALYKKIRREAKEAAKEEKITGHSDDEDDDEDEAVA